MHVKFAMLKRIHYMRRTRTFFVVCALFVGVYMPFASFAQTSGDFSFSPVLIDEKAKPRDILKQTLTIQNTSNRKLNLFPSVNNINPAEGEQGFAPALNADDRSESLANWIELSRGVIELSPGEEKTIPFVIRVNLNAIPGEYHANISFYEGSTRDAAERGTALGKMTVNLEVQADIKEVLQLNKFFSDNIFFAGDDVLFNYQLENIGNQNLQPKGEIRVYDNRGKEVASLEVNEEGKSIAPDEMSQLASVWSAASGFGRYKAFLNVDYGESQKASVQDTVFFWIIPWQQLVGMLVASLAAIVFFALYVHRKLDARYHAHHALAHATVAPVPTSAPLLTPRTQEGDEKTHKRPLFSFFKRSQEKKPEENMGEPTPEPSKRTRSLRDALGDTPLVPPKASIDLKPTRTTAPTIDLTNVHSHKEKPGSGHVINLKDHS